MAIIRRREVIRRKSEKVPNSSTAKIVKSIRWFQKQA